MNDLTVPQILVLDDDEIILVAIEETLKSAGYTVVTANSPEKALQLVREQFFAVILSDYQMPGMTGLEFFLKSKEYQPDASRILLTAVITLKTIIDAVNMGEIYRFIAKPWVREELLITVSNAIQRYDLIVKNALLIEQKKKLADELKKANSALEEKVKDLQRNNTALDVTRRSLENNFQQSVELCYRIISTFHPILGKQTKTIVNLCNLLCAADYLDESEKHVLKIASWLHNIGLIGIPRDIVNRSVQSPQLLDLHELAIIKNHPIYGQTFSGFVENLRLVGETIRAHHEHWDGSGYPDGSMHENIPKPARLLAVVVFYVECGLSRHEAVEEIIAQSNRAFEPEAVRLFLKVTDLVKLPPKVKEILFSELEPGMVLAQGIETPNGLLLLPEDHKLDALTLKKLSDHNLVDPVPKRILVYF